MLPAVSALDDPENTLSRRAVKDAPAGATSTRAQRAWATLGAASLTLGLLGKILEIALGYTRDLGEIPLPNFSHLLAVGVVGSVFGLQLVRTAPSLASDAEPRKGIGPRTFWVFAVGLALQTLASPLADRFGFASILSLAGVMMEAAAGVLFFVAARRMTR